MKTLVLASCVLSLLLLTSTYAEKHSSQPPSHGITIANMDTAVVPGDDFYLYANGAWIKRTPIPPDRSRIGVFSKLADLTEKQTRGIIETVSKSKSAEGSESRQIADLYASFMDEKGIESRGLTPLKSHLEAIAAIKNKQELARALGESLRADVDPLNNTNFHTANLFGL
ncbi:MAG TPA: M13 family peptidase, partial [Candidatus Angelobacter sp.]|nr:M13 family peptidase [Candidatus Angelobacter sp.]